MKLRRRTDCVATAVLLRSFAGDVVGTAWSRGALFVVDAIVASFSWTGQSSVVVPCLSGGGHGSGHRGRGDGGRGERRGLEPFDEHVDAERQLPEEDRDDRDH